MVEDYDQATGKNVKVAAGGRSRAAPNLAEADLTLDDVFEADFRDQQRHSRF